MRKIFTLFVAVFVLITSCTEKTNDHIINSADCPLNEIIYTTKYDYPIELNKTNGFGGNIVSHTYEDGIGKIVFDDDVICIPEYAFRDCTTITTIILPNSLLAIGEYAFWGCESLTSITIPDSVTSIGKYAFSGCSSLTSFYGGLASEDNRCLIIDGELLVFTDVGLTEYSIPDGVTTIGKSAFNGCDSLTSITIPDSVTTIGKSAFSNCDSLTSITIPDSVTTIGEHAFSSCDSLASATIGDSVITIGEWAFASCHSLTSITIPDSVTSIRNDAFNGCDSLASATIGDRVIAIGESAFAYCRSLTSITIPYSVTEIGSYAFYDCDSLKAVYCKATFPPIGGYGMFSRNASGRLIYVPAVSVDIYKTTSYWDDYKDYIIASSDF